MPDRPFPIDFGTLDKGAKPNTFLVLPHGFESVAAPDLTSPVFQLEPAALLDAFKAVALAAPRTTLEQEADGQIELVQRSAVFRFPDYITAEAVAIEGGAALCVFSRSKVGYSDLGVNAKRVKAWLAALEAQT
jgi:uncharacterized protein (DUF1499 family)